MPADLDAVALVAQVVGVVDHPVRQPQQPAFNGLEMRVGHASPPFRAGVRIGQDLRGFRAISAIMAPCFSEILQE